MVLRFIETDRSNVTISVTSRAMMPIDISPIAMKLTLVHIIAILFASVIIIVSVLLGKSTQPTFHH